MHYRALFSIFTQKVTSYQTFSTISSVGQDFNSAVREVGIKCYSNICYKNILDDFILLKTKFSNVYQEHDVFSNSEHEIREIVIQNFPSTALWPFFDWPEKYVIRISQGT